MYIVLLSFKHRVFVFAPTFVCRNSTFYGIIAEGGVVRLSGNEYN